MAYNKTVLNSSELTLLLLSVILQIVSLSTLGWYISGNNEGSTAYVGVFYMKECLNSTCETWSKHERFHEEQLAYMTKFEYNEQIAEQVYMILTFVCTSVALVVQFCKCGHGDKRFPKSTGFASVCLAFASGFMIVILTSNYIETDYLLEMSTKVNDLGFQIFFPYCILLYTLAFITNITAAVLCMVDVFRQEGWMPRH